MFSDSSSTIEAQIAGDDLPKGDNLANNGIMAMFEHIVFPFRRLRSAADSSVEISLVDSRAKQYGGYDGLKEDVAKGLVDTKDLWCVLAKELNAIMEPVREEQRGSTKWQLAEQLAYDDVDMASMRV